MSEAQSVQSVVKAVQVLRLLGDAPEGLSLQELAGAMGQKAPGVHHLVQTLVAGGLVERTPAPLKYRIGAGVFELVARQSSHWLRKEAVDALRRIVETIPEANGILTQVQEGEVVATVRISPEQPGVVQKPVRQSMGAYASASSLMFQAYWPAGALREFRSRYAFEEYDTGWGSVEELDGFLARARELGYVSKPPKAKSGPGMVAVSAPVFGREGQLLAGIGASVRVEEAAQRGRVEEKLIALVLEGKKFLEGKLVF